MTYPFVKSPPFNLIQLSDEIVTAGLPTPNSFVDDDVNLTIGFAVTLDAGQQTTLGTVVAAHTPTPGYVSLATQAAIATLTGYLNNANATIANTARAVMISIIAPNLPPGLLATINATIATKLGGG